MKPNKERVSGLGRAGFLAALLLSAGLGVMAACSDDDGPTGPQPPDPALVTQGKDIFRFNTFGDETFWTDTLRIHDIITSAVDPTTALSVGLKVDAEALPAEVVQGIQDGSISLTDPATTVALLKLNAVVGLKGTVETVNGKDTLTAVGTTCALCHSTVNNSFDEGIGARLDGWPNRDLNVGAIVSLAPDLRPVARLLGTDVATVKKVLAAWGPGKFDAELFLDGKGFRPDGKTAAVYRKIHLVPFGEFVPLSDWLTFFPPLVQTLADSDPFLVLADFRAPQEPAPTFARDIAPIVFNSCTSCHRPGGPGPFSLATHPLMPGEFVEVPVAAIWRAARPARRKWW